MKLLVQKAARHYLPGNLSRMMRWIRPMGFLKNWGTTAGKLVGAAVGGTIELVGEVVDSSFVKEVGKGVYYSTASTGRIAGQLVEGVATAYVGLFDEDNEKVRSGLNEAGDAAKELTTGVAQTVVRTVRNAGEVVSGVINDDPEAIKHGAVGIAKTVAIGVLAVGFADMLLDEVGIEEVGEPMEPVLLGEVETMEPLYAEAVLEVEPTSEHFVEPHNVEGYFRSDGTHVADYWRDGDGDTAINLDAEEGGGYLRRNPST